MLHQRCTSVQELLRGMLARAVHARQPVRDIPDAPYFKQDRLLRALRFLDTLLQRDAAQKAAFLRDLPAFWAQFDARTLRLRVLPALMALWHDEALRDGVLPLVLTIAQDLPADTFQNQACASVAFVWLASDVVASCLTNPPEGGSSEGRLRQIVSQS